MSSISAYETDEEESPPIVWGDPNRYDQPISPTAHFGLLDDSDDDDVVDEAIDEVERQLIENETDADVMLRLMGTPAVSILRTASTPTTLAVSVAPSVTQEVVEHDGSQGPAKKARNFRWALEDKQKMLRVAYPKREDGTLGKNVGGAAKQFLVNRSYFSRWLKSFNKYSVDIHGPLVTAKGEDALDDGLLRRKGMSRHVYGKEKTTFHAGRRPKMSTENPQRLIFVNPHV